MSKLAIIFIVISGVACNGATSKPKDHPSFSLQEGDIVFQTSQSSQSQAIKIATGSIYTHMGIVIDHEAMPLVLEAVQPVKFTPYLHWIDRGEGKRVVVKRLKTARKTLTPDALKDLHKIAESFLGRPYDLQFLWSDERLYCSELVYKLLDRATGIKIGTPKKAREFNLNNPAVQKKIRERFGSSKGDFNLDEPIISPQSMFDDPQLVTVFEN